jgi:acetylornithine deacetylase/succinyl-diaminopimelate desuccinylase-like protein
MRFIIVVISFLVSDFIIGQTPYVDKIHTYWQKNEASIYNDFLSFLKIPNVASDTVNIRKNADFLVLLMKAKGITNVQLLETDLRNVPPVAYGEVIAPGAAKTIIFYAHYDGQPVNPALWAKDLHPFQPQLINGRIDEQAVIQTSVNFPLNQDWRIYARGASDDKGGVMAILSAFTAIKESGLKFPYNIKFFFEGEEEQG